MYRSVEREDEDGYGRAVEEREQDTLEASHRSSFEGVFCDADASLFESARDEQEAMFHRTHPSRKVKLDRENSGHKADCFPVLGEQNTCTHRSTRIVLPAPSWPTSSDLAHRFVTSVPTPWSATLPVVRMSTKSLLPLPPWSLTR